MGCCEDGGVWGVVKMVMKLWGRGMNTVMENYYCQLAEQGVWF